MHFIFVDTETVDIPQDTSRPINDIDNWPAIRQIAWIVCDENRNILKQYNYVIGSTHPVDNSIENYLPQEIKPIHKIIPSWMHDIASSVYLIGHNVEYDVKVISAEMFRLGYDTHLIEKIPQICTMRSSIDFCYFAGRVESRFPKLQELYTKLFHEPFINAHDAYCDIYATYECFWALVDKGIISKSDYEELYTQQELKAHLNTLSTKVQKEQKNSVKKDDLGVTYSADGKRLITTHNQYGYSVLKEAEEYTIPAGVEVICDKAFWYATGLKRIVIPKSVKKIGNAAFYFCNKLKIVCYSPYFGSIISNPYGHDLYDKVNNRILSFFDNPGGVECLNMTGHQDRYYDTVQIENTDKGTLTIGEYAFAGSDIKHIIIGDGVSIERNAFYACRSLVSIHLPETMTEMPEHVLSDCRNLQSINIPKQLKTIGVGSLFYCTSLKNLLVPETVTEIGEYAFKCCEGLEEVGIPEAVTQINKETFANCGKLKRFEIKNSIERISSNPFVECFNLNIIGTERFVFQDGALYDEVEKRLISYIGTSISYSVREGTLIIGKRAFCNCKSLSIISLPESVASIEEEAFYGCDNLQSINLPSAITKIKKNTFYLCKSIQQLSIPYSVTVVEDSALYHCSSMTDLYVYNPKIQLLGSYPFLSCDALKNIYVPEGTMDQFMRNWSFGDKRGLIREPGAKGILKRWWKNK